LAVTEREEREVQVDTDLLGQLGGSPDSIRALLDSMKVKAFSDWAGRLCVTARDARKVLEIWRKRQEEQARLLAEYDLYLRDFNRRRQAAWDEAYEKAAEEELHKQYVTPFAVGSNGMGWAEGGVRFAQRLEIVRRMVGTPASRRRDNRLHRMAREMRG